MRELVLKGLLFVIGSTTVLYGGTVSSVSCLLGSQKASGTASCALVSSSPAYTIVQADASGSEIIAGTYGQVDSFSGAGVLVGSARLGSAPLFAANAASQGDYEFQTLGPLREGSISFSLDMTHQSLRDTHNQLTITDGEHTFHFADCDCTYEVENAPFLLGTTFGLDVSSAVTLPGGPASATTYGSAGVDVFFQLFDGGQPVLLSDAPEPASGLLCVPGFLLCVALHQVRYGTAAKPKPASDSAAAQ